MFQSGVGEFDLNKIISLGGKDNSISSIIVPDGYNVIVFKNDQFKGEAKLLTPKIIEQKT